MTLIFLGCKRWDWSWSLGKIDLHFCYLIILGQISVLQRKVPQVFQWWIHGCNSITGRICVYEMEGEVPGTRPPHYSGRWCFLFWILLHLCRSANWADRRILLSQQFWKVLVTLANCIIKWIICRFQRIQLDWEPTFWSPHFDFR